MNEIAEVEFETNLPLFFDAYRDNRWTGSLILIDGVTNATVGAGMIVAAVDSSIDEERRAVLVLVPGQVELAERVREGLVARGERAVVVDDALDSCGFAGWSGAGFAVGWGRGDFDASDWRQKISCGFRGLRRVGW